MYHNPLQPLGHNLSDSGYMEVIINHPYTETGKGHLPGNFLPANLVNLPARKVLESLFLPTINKYIIPAQDQHGFRREHSTTSALPQLTTDVAVGFNQRKPPDRTVCFAVDLSAAFDTVCHNNLLSNINRSQLPPATARWLSCYRLNAQGYWGSIWTPHYHSTSTGSMWQREYQVGTTSLRPWQVLHGDNKRKHY